ncbi:hypothetical protein RJG79_04495 [Mycoplasmatota bacterium WC44]
MLYKNINQVTKITLFDYSLFKALEDTSKAYDYYLNYKSNFSVKSEILGEFGINDKDYCIERWIKSLGDLTSCITDEEVNKDKRYFDYSDEYITIGGFTPGHVATNTLFKNIKDIRNKATHPFKSANEYFNKYYILFENTGVLESKLFDYQKLIARDVFEYLSSKYSDKIKFSDELKRLGVEVGFLET